MNTHQHNGEDARYEADLAHNQMFDSTRIVRNCILSVIGVCCVLAFVLAL